ncbi:hypothetical protein ABIA32_006404 [Streptacidiphilus sp. MAP12-20]
MLVPHFSGGSRAEAAWTSAHNKIKAGPAESCWC